MLSAIEFGPKLEISLNDAVSSERNRLTAESGTDTPGSDKVKEENTMVPYIPGLSWVRMWIYSEHPLNLDP